MGVAEPTWQQSTRVGRERFGHVEAFPLNRGSPMPNNAMGGGLLIVFLPHCQIQIIFCISSYGPGRLGQVLPGVTPGAYFFHSSAVKLRERREQASSIKS